MDSHREARQRTARSELTRWLRSIVPGLALLIAIMVGTTVLLGPACTLIYAPWSMGLDGAPTLTGIWVGPLQSKWGSQYYLYLELDWKMPSRRSSRASLPGVARICNSAGREFSMAVSGDADRAAQDVRIDVEARDSRFRESLPLRGVWHGAELQLVGHAAFDWESSYLVASSAICSVTH